jgi:hypothetical protein
MYMAMMITKLGSFEKNSKSSSPKIDVLRLQEHKCRGDTIDRTSKILWHNDSFWNPKAIPTIGGEYVLEKEEWPCASTRNSRISLWIEELL